MVICSPVPTQIPVQAPPPQSNVDLAMEAAFQQARDTLVSFTQKIDAPHPDRTLVVVKVRFVLPDSSAQDLWGDRITYKDG
jgi:hypothetical protein